MKKIKSLILIVLFIAPAFIACSQSYKIDIQIDDLKNEDIYLGYYYGDKTYVKDTIKLDNNGKGTFKGDTLLDQGVYIVVMPTKNYFDLLIGDDQEFSLETSTENLVENLKIKGSQENIAFKDFQSYMIIQNKKLEELQNQLKSISDNSDSTKIIKDQMDDLSKNVKSYWAKTISEHEGTILGVVIKAMRNPEIPEIEIPESVHNKDSVRWFHAYNYNQQHYFDDINFSDKRFLRTPIFHNKLDTYFTKILIQDPDTIDKYIDVVATKAESEKEMYKYIMLYFINTFQKSNIMGMDKVIVHVAENYLLTDKTDWLSEETLQKLKEQVAKLKFNLIGDIAQDLKMETLNGEYSRLSEVKAKYTLVMFWEPNCGHCKKVVPEIYDIYKEFTRDEFEVFAVYTQTDKEEWAKYIEEKGFDEWINAWDPYNLTNFRFFYNVYSTPTLYLLDKDKKIIAKRIGSETVKNILEIELGKKNIKKVIEDKKERD